MLKNDIKELMLFCQYLGYWKALGDFNAYLTMAQRTKIAYDAIYPEKEDHVTEQ